MPAVVSSAVVVVPSGVTVSSETVGVSIGADSVVVQVVLHSRLGHLMSYSSNTVAVSSSMRTQCIDPNCTPGPHVTAHEEYTHESHE